MFKKYNHTLPFLISLVLSVIAGLVFYRSFFEFFDHFFGPITGFSGLVVDPYLRLRIAVFDFSYTFFLAFFLSFFFDWRETLRYWAYGYLILIGLSLLAGGIFIPNPLRLLFVLVSASVGFLMGQGLRFIFLRFKK